MSNLRQNFSLCQNIFRQSYFANNWQIGRRNLPISFFLVSPYSIYMFFLHCSIFLLLSSHSLSSGSSSLALHLPPYSPTSLFLLLPPTFAHYFGSLSDTFQHLPLLPGDHSTSSCHPITSPTSAPIPTLHRSFHPSSSATLHSPVYTSIPPYLPFPKPPIRSQCILPYTFPLSSCSLLIPPSSYPTPSPSELRLQFYLDLGWRVARPGAEPGTDGGQEEEDHHRGDAHAASQHQEGGGQQLLYTSESGLIYILPLSVIVCTVCLIPLKLTTVWQIPPLPRIRLVDPIHVFGMIVSWATTLPVNV